MTITISVFAVVVILFVLNTILGHLFNWWIRSIDSEDTGKVILLFTLWVIKTIIVVGILYNILK